MPVAYAGDIYLHIVQAFKKMWKIKPTKGSIYKYEIRIYALYLPITENYKHISEPICRETEMYVIHYLFIMKYFSYI